MGDFLFLEALPEEEEDGGDAGTVFPPADCFLGVVSICFGNGALQNKMVIKVEPF